MTREEILEKSRQENKHADEREKQIKANSGTVSRNAALMVCVLLMRLNMQYDGPWSFHFALFALATGMGAARSWFVWFRLKKKIELFYAIGYTLMFLVSIYYVVTYLMIERT